MSRAVPTEARSLAASRARGGVVVLGVLGAGMGVGMVASVVAAAPASAATCADAAGVSVVVDRASLGGGVSTGCDADGGGKPASVVSPAGGAGLTYASREPGFVCRVNAVPASDPCQQASPADAYWSLWWSDGTSGTWTYSSLGAAGLKVPAGGSIGWRFSTGSQSPPASPAPVHSTGSGGTGGSGGSGARAARVARVARVARAARPVAPVLAAPAGQVTPVAHRAGETRRPRRRALRSRRPRRPRPRPRRPLPPRVPGTGRVAEEPLRRVTAGDGAVG